MTATDTGAVDEIERTHFKIGQFDSYFKTRDEAVAYLVAIAEADVSQSEKTLARCQANLAKARAL